MALVGPPRRSDPTFLVQHVVNVPVEDVGRDIAPLQMLEHLGQG